jgi:spermidine synthase
MIPWTLLGTAEIPNGGGQLKLTQREKEFSIHLKGVRGELMNSRVHSSELVLAELGCSDIKAKENAHVLVGGLGMGFTLSAALKSVLPCCNVVVAELVPEVVEWNKGVLGECAGRPLNDSRTRVYLGDVAQLLTARQAKQQRKRDYDSILLDIDNGPEGFTHSDNNNLYSLKSLKAIRKALNLGGTLAIWSAWADPKFIVQLKKARFKVESHTVRAHKGKGSRHTIYLAKKTVN